MAECIPVTWKGKQIGGEPPSRNEQMIQTIKRVFDWLVGGTPKSMQHDIEMALPVL